MLKLYMHHCKVELKKKYTRREVSFSCYVKSFSFVEILWRSRQAYQTFWSSVRIENVFTVVILCISKDKPFGYTYKVLDSDELCIIFFIFSQQAFELGIYNVGTEDSQKFSELSKARKERESLKIQVSLMGTGYTTYTVLPCI